MIIQDNDPHRGPSFSLGNRVRRFAWNIICTLLFRLSPRPFHRWRSVLLRAFGAKLGKGVHVYPDARIWAPWNLELGDHVGIADGVIIYNMDVIRIGNNSVISQGAHLCGGSHDYNSGNFQLFAKPIVLGERVWICAEAFIAPGVSIANGVVIGARSVVTKNVSEPWTVCAGHPAKQIGRRKRGIQ
jgi:putative colanic acid biosynthesis acetyltransferase WcaF